ncbi:thioesterase [Clostridium niameyense]|uniref:Thioesterase n=1 Tax=Clostridium niameyense TaxID=1622073 RepID=A0A6M0RAI0_9CLOT|nr:thioesterase domain-containing protein [Clostridium niameyense]NEZ47261.1 thioesterase [Clostridium niameyense]
MFQPGKLIKDLDTVKETDSIMYCFPYAGAGASTFRNWNKALNSILKVCPIQLPGREERILEKPYLDMEKLADDIAQLILHTSNKFFLFGHSMGTKIAYEVEKRLEAKGRITELLIVSGGRVPHISEPHPIYNLPDKEFEEGLIRFDGMPKEIIKNRQLFQFFLPIIRADFILDESYNSTNTKPLKCPILSLGGNEDKDGNLEEIKKWAYYTENDFNYRIFKGKHFFIKQQEKEVLMEIKKKIVGL